MQGFSVWFQPGFDCGGLPIENKVEEKLNIQSKGDIEKIGVDKFIEECNKFAKGNEPVWLDLYKKIGAWRGWVKPYLTSENYYLESGWWTIKRLFEKGLLVEGKRPSYWCSHCETVLSGYEVTDSYKELEDPSIYIKFKVKGRKNEYLIVWTTTPWTLNANVVVAVHPDETYVKIEVGSEKFIMAKKRLEILEDMGMGYRIIEEMKGSELDGIEYEPPLDVPLQKELNERDNVHEVVLSVPLMKKKVSSKVQAKKETEDKESEFDHIVTMDTGSGLVHIAPGHGEVDNKLGKHYGLPEISPVDDKGNLMEKTGKFEGMYVKKADKPIINYLKENNRLLKYEPIKHKYPLCWRCKTPLIFRMSKQWFLKSSELKDKILKENKKVKWMPEFAKKRFDNNVKEAPDWAITRQRYWGIPFPVWECENCGKKTVIGSREELKENAIEDVKEDMDLHKHNVDNIHIECDCGEKMGRIPDIMDVWFDSGISPWASLGYPFKNKELFETLRPVDLIDESQDQVRGWFYSLFVSSMATFDERAYNAVCLNGWTLDDKGNKMSKSEGNVVWAKDAYESLGADVLRLYICSDVAPWETQKFSMENAKEINKHLNILWNSYNYFKTYCKIDEGKIENPKIEDIWVLSRLNRIIKTSTENLEEFYFHEASRGIIDFLTNDFSRTYIKLVRNREDDTVNKVFTQILKKTLKLLSVFAPFISEEIYEDMFNVSVHKEKWPNANESLLREDLEEDMKKANKIVETANSIRQKESLKLRWPLKAIKMDIDLKNEDVKEIIKRMANVKEILIEDEVKGEECEFGVVALDNEIIKEEALLRELRRAIQQKRKEEDLVVEDRIKLYLNNKDLQKYKEEIKKEVGAKEIIFTDLKEEMDTVSFKDTEVKFKFEKI